MRLSAALSVVGWLAAAAVAAVVSPATPQSTPPSPPAGPMHYARARDYHLQHIVVHLSLDWSHNSFSGEADNTLCPLRDDLTEIDLDAGANLTITSCRVNGIACRYAHTADRLAIQPPPSLAPVRRGAAYTVAVSYHCASAPQGRASPRRAEGYFWITPSPFEPERRPAFYTYGWPENTHTWAPTYDYPNDKATSEVYVRAPESWFVISNGQLVGSLLDPSSHTRSFHWKMAHPHATYLLSIAAGEMDVLRSKWHNVDLLYAVPRGELRLVPTSFADTPRMIDFYSSILGASYPWSKYAQTCEFDFGGGLENVTATTLQESALADPRSGYFPMASLNAHELAHQWFGDDITCRDWGDVWLSEGFATFFQQMYAEHSLGRDAYDAERDSALARYLAECRRYRRPIVTNRCPSPYAMLDAHSYQKGALVLHMLRRSMGDRELFRGLRYYLNTYAYQCVDTHDLVRALEESTGRALDDFFDQWIYKPGHPVIQYSWRWDSQSSRVILTVSQVQDTKDGTPIYHVDVPVGILYGSELERRTVTLSSQTQEFTLNARLKPNVVLLDPGHDILMERRPRDWQPGEAMAVLQHAPCWLDRRDAALALLAGSPSDDVVRLVGSECLRQLRAHPALSAAVLPRLGELRQTSLRSLYESVIANSHVEPRRLTAGQAALPRACAAAINALASLPKSDPDTTTLSGFISPAELYSTCEAAINTLASWDAEGNMPTLRRALGIDSRNDEVRLAALGAIATCPSEDALSLVAQCAAPGHSRQVRQRAVRLLGSGYRGRPLATRALVGLLSDADLAVVREAISRLGDRGDQTAVPALRALQADAQRPREQRDAAGASADKIEHK